MGKKYYEYIEEITADDLYEGLLGYGMFPDKLPPIFSSVSFYSYCKSCNPQFPNKWHGYIQYSSIRNINIPRVFGIPTPMNYQRLCWILKESWDSLKLHFDMQTYNHRYCISRIHLRKMFGSKQLFEMNYKNWRTDGNPEVDLLFLTDKKVSKYLVKADISTCFPSIYSHALPWAIVGKEIAKKKCKDCSVWYNKIDKACYSLKNGETHGLLIGPHASNLLSEIILIVVDNILYNKGYSFYRNIDDYGCYVDSYERAQCFLRDLEDALREYDLPLNHKKTAIIALPNALTEKWIHKLNNSFNDELNYKEVNAYLDLAINLALEKNDSAVLKYAVKTLAGKSLTINAQKLAAKRIMHLSNIYPYLIQLMDEFVFTPFEVSKEHKKQYADTICSEMMKSNNYEGIIFAIYFSLKYDFVLDVLDIEWVVEKKDCVLLLMTWLYYLKQCGYNRRKKLLTPLIQEAKKLRDLDIDKYWLFCYEVLSECDLKDDWKVLKKNHISFIDIC